MASSSLFCGLFLSLFAFSAASLHIGREGNGAAIDPKKIHKHMSVDELRSVFHVDRHDKVPEYQLVSVSSRRIKRSVDSSSGSSHSLHLEAFGRPFHLSLRPNGALLGGGPLRVWTAHANGSSAGGVQYEEVPQADIGDLYQDLENEAALLVHRDPKDGALLVDGTIGSNLVVKPAPASVRWRMLKGKGEGKREGKGEEDGGGKGADDDEMFLDQEGEEGQMAVGARGFPFGRRRFDYDLPEEEEGGAEGRNNGEVAAAEAEVKEERRGGVEEEHNKGVKKEHSTGLHIVFKRSSEDLDSTLSDYAFMEPDQMPHRKRKRRSIKKREAPYVIYPEILVIVDYDGYRLHGGDNVQIKRYFVSFWNGVDLRYKLLKGPKIRISIAGIIISRGRDATPYLERNRVGRDAIDSAAALTDMGKYLFRERRLPVYDIAVAVTKLDMCRRQYANDVCNRGTAGFAYVGGACVVNKRLEKVNSVAIIEDTGGFSGIIVAAHEVGHLLGAVHDGSPPPSYLGGPGAEKCRWEDGFIMSDLRHTERGFKWSPCSISSFHHFLNGETATCLYNSPHEDESLPRVLPGKLLSLDAQCRKDRGTSACFKDERVCAQLFCFDSGSGYCVAYRPAAEGSTCGDGQYCINGRCVAEHENIIPDYTQIMPSFLSRRGGDSGEETLATRPRPVFAPLTNNVTHRSSPWTKFWEQRSTTPIPFHYAFRTIATTTTPRPNSTPFPRQSFPFHPFHHSTANSSNPYSKPSYPFSTPYPPTSRSYIYSSTPKAYSLPAKPYSPAVKPYSPAPKPYSLAPKPYSPAPKPYTPAPKPYFPVSEVTPFPKYVFTTPKPYLPGQDIFHSNQKPPQAPFHNPYQHLSSSSTTTTTTTSKQLRVHGRNNGTDEGSVCEDKAQAVGGGNMSCADFLTRYGSQYCDYQYILRNCCASQKAFCSRSSQR